MNKQPKVQPVKQVVETLESKCRRCPNNGRAMSFCEQFHQEVVQINKFYIVVACEGYDWREKVEAVAV